MRFSLCTSRDQEPAIGCRREQHSEYAAVSSRYSRTQFLLVRIPIVVVPDVLGVEDFVLDRYVCIMWLIDI